MPVGLSIHLSVYIFSRHYFLSHASPPIKKNNNRLKINVSTLLNRASSITSVSIYFTKRTAINQSITSSMYPHQLAMGWGTVSQHSSVSGQHGYTDSPLGKMRCFGLECYSFVVVFSPRWLETRR